MTIDHIDYVCMKSKGSIKDYLVDIPTAHGSQDNKILTLNLDQKFEGAL